MRAKRTLCLAHSGNIGGAERSLDAILRHLDQGRHEVTVVFAWEGAMSRSAEAVGHKVEVDRLAWWLCIDPTPWYWKDLVLGSLPRVLRLVRKIRRERIDLVYSNTAVIFEGALAAMLARVPHVWHVREILPSEHMRPRLLPLSLITRLIGLLSHRVVFNSEASRRFCRGRIPDEKSVVIRNSVPFEIDETGSNGAAIRQRLGIGPEERIVLWAGRLSPRKDPLLLIRSIRRMKRAGGTRFLFAGEGPLRQEMLQTIDELGLDKVCRVLGFQTDIRPLLDATDLLVLTSREEAFGLVLAEAGAFGKPVVATRVDGPAEIVVDGETGFLVEPGDERDLAARVDHLLGDDKLRRAMGERAACRAADLYSVEKNVRRLEEVFEQAIDSHRRKERPARPDHSR